ncbi:REP-associated tyrosine transposase [Treponema sp. TIM-1]|uniref:REP-associated tyrosine transposase n=1 Tax=Treponema sp. TIM-1 TaxID=2898417 RepID=UPI00397EA9F2
MRHPRKLKDNATYHVTVRANRREMVLFCTAMRILFLNVVKRAKKKYKFQIDNFSIMGNHVHLIIRPGKDESLSRIMQWILSVFAMAWNRAHFQTGHVWGERFFSKIINDCIEFIKTFHYISQNPVKAQLVKSPEEWEFGGLWHFISGKKEIIGEPASWIQEIYRNY